MKIIGDEEGVGLYFQGELEMALLFSLLQRHVNLCIKESYIHKGMYQEDREIHPTEHLATTILEAFQKGNE